jgi:membrane protease YdiL (CAAX protease family)
MKKTLDTKRKYLKTMKSSAFNWITAKQLSVLQIVLAVFIPSIIGFAGFHYLLPIMVRKGIPILIAWPAIASSGFVIIVAGAILFIYHESKQLGISFNSRLCMRKVGLKPWLFYIGLMILCIFLSIPASKLSVYIINSIHFKIPQYMPFFLNPAIDSMKTDISVLSPGFNLSHQYWMIPIMAVVLLFNILAEELYFRAWMIPKLSRFGNGAWILNGVLFALYHTFQLWLLPVILIASLIFAFIFYKSKSIWPSFIGHLVINFLGPILGITMLIMK